MPAVVVAYWDWYGENPDLWYPLNIRFTVVVVAKGATFGGWDKYVGPVVAGEQIDATASDAGVDLSLDSTYGSNVPEDMWLQESNEETQQTQKIFLPNVMN